MFYYGKIFIRGKILANQVIRPRHSVLYMPASNLKAIEKAKTLNADCLVFDLEDAVAPEMKASARAELLSIMQIGGFGERELIIRCNAIDSEWFAEDIKAAILAKAHAILIPKINSKAEVLQVDNFVREHNIGTSIDLWAMIESPRAILDIFNISSASIDVPLRTLVLGTNDLAKETNAKIDLMRLPFHYALSAVVYGARAFGLCVIDGVWNDIANIEGFETQCRQAKDFGFDGKTLIHPNQIEKCNKIFAPSDKEIAEAQEIISAFESNENIGKGAIKVNGQMVEILHYEMAKTLITAHNRTHGLTNNQN